MKKLIDFIIMNHPEYAEEIEGCTEGEIAVFEALIPNRKIPEEYKEFLMCIGKKTGRVFGLRRNWKGELEDRNDPRMIIDIDYNSVIKYYKNAIKRGWNGLSSFSEDYGVDSSNFFLFGIDHLGNDNWHLYLDLRHPDLPVVEISGTVEFRQHAPSFRSFLFDLWFHRTLQKFEYSKEWL